MLLLGDIPFLSKGFLFLARSRYSGVKCCLLVVLNGHRLGFFLFLFPSCCHSIVYRVVCIVSDGCNQSSFVFLMYSSSRCIDASTVSSMLASPLPPSFLDTYSLLT